MENLLETRQKLSRLLDIRNDLNQWTEQISNIMTAIENGEPIEKSGRFLHKTPTLDMVEEGINFVSTLNVEDIVNFVTYARAKASKAN